MAKIDNQSTVVNSDSSAQSANPRTSKTVSLTLEQSFEILQQALLNCQHAGIDVKVSPFYRDGNRSVILVLANVDFVDGNIVLASR